MSEIIDKIVEGAGQVMSEVDKGGQIQSAISGLRHRMAEADRRRKLNTIKQEIQELQGKEAQSINALSAQVLALYEAGSLTQPELISLCKRVDQIREQIEVKEAELASLEPAPSAEQPVEPQPAVSQATPQTVCPSCGVPIVTGAAFCQSCGATLSQAQPPVPVHFCVHCGAQLREGARFCPKCGQTVPSSP
ncbi:MAG: zinc-ribbon domain-containing protein [Anaerolineae bacterium]